MITQWAYWCFEEVHDVENNAALQVTKENNDAQQITPVTLFYWLYVHFFVERTSKATSVPLVVILITYSVHCV